MASKSNTNPSDFTNEKRYATQRTFDSTDDLIDDSDDDDDEEVQNNNNNAAPPTEVTTNSGSKSCGGDDGRSVWSVKAIHWPPNSVKTIVKEGLTYIKSPFLIIEILVLVVFLYLCYILPDYLVSAHHRPIPIQTLASTGETLIDLTFDNPYHHNETIPGSLLNLLCVVFPIGVFAGIGFWLGPTGDFHAAICMYLLAMGSKIFVVACIKNYAGYLRPSFYNMCQYNPETLVCDDETTSARESFPSGHAATALSSMTLLAIFLLGKVRGGVQQRGVKAAAAAANRNNHDPDDEIWTPSLPSKVLAVMAVSPIFLGMFIATSRVRDNWHHPADVLCGGVIGVGCALFAHSLWYPSVYSYYAGIPLATVRKIVVGRKQQQQQQQQINKKKATGRPKIDLDNDSDLYDS